MNFRTREIYATKDHSGMIGMEVEFQDEGAGMVTDETEDAIYIVSKFFTGWMFKAEYFESLGAE